MSQLAYGHPAERKIMRLAEVFEPLNGGLAVKRSVSRSIAGAAQSLQEDILSVRKFAAGKALFDECFKFRLGDLYGHNRLAFFR
jgi:hypothetical protein